jgi:HEAT repeat protein
MGALVAKADPRELGLLAEKIPFVVPPAGTLETVLARGLADPAYDLADLAVVGEVLAAERPTRKLYPLVERLLASDDPALARKGVHMAQSLGQPDLLPKLAKLLDSLDPNVRTAAQNAMASIAELERLRREARTELGAGDED